MFEDSTFESTGRIRTRSRGRMIASFAFNGSILLAFVLLPLIYPDALPRQAIAFLMEAPPPPAPPTPPRPEPVRAVPVHSELTYTGSIQAPSVIPKTILDINTPEPRSDFNVATLGPEALGTSGAGPIFSGPSIRPVVHPDIKTAVRVPSSIEAGLLIQKTIPTYPPLGKAMNVEGTVVLAATISKNGTIENLRAVSGPPILQAAALDAVKSWRYRPYLLNGQPVEVETSVNVIFTLGR